MKENVRDSRFRRRSQRCINVPTAQDFKKRRKEYLLRKQPPTKLKLSLEFAQSFRLGARDAHSTKSGSAAGRVARMADAEAESVEKKTEETSVHQKIEGTEQVASPSSPKPPLTPTQPQPSAATATDWGKLRRSSVTVAVSPNGQWEARQTTGEDGESTLFFVKTEEVLRASSIPEEDQKPIVVDPSAYSLQVPPSALEGVESSDDEDEAVVVEEGPQVPPQSIPVKFEAVPDGPASTVPESVIRSIQSLPGNQECVDCGAGSPEWASISNGVLLCMNCSGLHRGLGVHISYVRSLRLDNWTPRQLASLQRGSNKTFKEWMARKPGVPAALSARYSDPHAELYRKRLEANVKGEVLPDSLPEIHVFDKEAAETKKNAAARRQTIGAPKYAPKWEPDVSRVNCGLCDRPFSFVLRRHHCRACGKLVCSKCAPSANTKPLPQLGKGLKPVRHCFRCYRSPFVDWAKYNVKEEHGGALTVSGGAASSSSSPFSSPLATAGRRLKDSLKHASVKKS